VIALAWLHACDLTPPAERPTPVFVEFTGTLESVTDIGLPNKLPEKPPWPAVRLEVTPREIRWQATGEPVTDAKERFFDLRVDAHKYVIVKHPGRASEFAASAGDDVLMVYDEANYKVISVTRLNPHL
jgi:hypothetical protein